MRPRALVLLFVLAACAPRPARFADAPPVERVADREPVPVPAIRRVLPELHDADVYVRRELVRALDPRDTPDAGDVNALDEVPESAFFRRTASLDKPLRGYRRDGAPVPPLRERTIPATSETPSARVVEDARGLAYELVPDEPDRPRMASGAAAATSRLLFALGYRTAEVHVVEVGGVRVAATRWPVGIDLGSMPTGGVRDDDPNDRIDHRDRRSLRALRLVSAWLDLVRLEPRMLRDHYVGRPSEGHVEHALVGVDGGLGVGRYREVLVWQRDADRTDGNLFFRAVTLGLSPVPVAKSIQTPSPSVGLFDEFVSPGEFSSSPPFEPADRLTPADAYWIAKRIADVPDRALGRAVRAGKLPPFEQEWLVQTLSQRRAQVVAWGLGHVTPLDAVRFSPADSARGRKARLLLVDRAVQRRLTEAASTTYDVELLDGEGALLEAKRGLPCDAGTLSLELDESVASREYVVASVIARRAGKALPRPVELHLRRREAALALVGVRH